MEKISCDVCKKKFKTEDALKQHTNDAHKQAPVESEQLTQHHKKKFSFGNVLAILIPALIVGVIGYGIFWALTTNGVGSLGSAHIHADLAIFLDGKQMTPLSRQYYGLSPYIALEQGIGAGTVLHMHATNVPLRMFFDSVGIKFDSQCFEITGSSRYCSSGNSTLKMFVEHVNSTWEQNLEYQKYVFHDLDKILISYGNDNTNQIVVQENNVTDLSKDVPGQSVVLKR